MNRADTPPYLDAALSKIGGALSLLDSEPTSVTRGSFDRTWWNWKFSDFSAPRFQEGAHVLAWLLTSPLSPERMRTSTRLRDGAEAAIAFWCRLQHRNGSFDEAYPFERSLAATAFTLFYVGSAIERLGDRLSPPVRSTALATVERAATWLASNGERHGVLSNHLAAAAAASQVADDLIGSGRYRAARDRFLGVIYREQDPDEDWMREYFGADPGYQSHGMFYLADILRRTGDRELGERLARASRFEAWFAHPDGTIGGEYSSRGTKFAFPAAFEMLAPQVPAAAAIAQHLRRSIAARRGVGLHEMDAWNLFPMLNNYLFAAEAARDLRPEQLPWMEPGATAVFPRAGLVVANRAGSVLAMAPGNGGALKLWGADGTLHYEDCGYGVKAGRKWTVSQGPSTWHQAPAGGHAEGKDPLELTSNGPFVSVPAVRFDPWRFMGFRAFTMTIGRFPSFARALKDALVYLLIRRRTPQTATLSREVRFDADGVLSITDQLKGLKGPPVPVARHVPYHMGSARYSGFDDCVEAATAVEEAAESGPGLWRRKTKVAPR